MTNLTPSIKTFDYFIDWKKAKRLFSEVEPEVNLLNVLVGKADPKSELDGLLKTYPSVVKAFPALFAYRAEKGGGKLDILVDYTAGQFRYEQYDLTVRPSYSPEQRANLIEFAEKVGILDLFRGGVTRSLPDYTYGVEVGIDTNGRKNRGGTLMEHVLAQILAPICDRRGWDLMGQPTKKKLKKLWGIDLAIDQTDSRPDLAVRTDTDVWMIETNFYNAQGSKLKATAGEYRGKFDWYRKHGHYYLWITDGTGWISSRAGLRECFDAIDYILNIRMCSAGCLEDVLSGP